MSFFVHGEYDYESPRVFYRYRCYCVRGGNFQFSNLPWVMYYSLATRHNADEDIGVGRSENPLLVYVWYIPLHI